MPNYFKVNGTCLMWLVLSMAGTSEDNVELSLEHSTRTAYGSIIGTICSVQCKLFFYHVWPWTVWREDFLFENMAYVALPMSIIWETSKVV